MSDWRFANLATQIIVNIAVTLVVVAMSLAVTGVRDSFRSCPKAIVGKMASAEGFLLRGDIANAERLASDALVTNPDAKCVQLLAASIEFDKMVAATRNRAPKIAEVARANCYRHAVAAGSFLETAPRVKALVESCSAREEIHVEVAAPKPGCCDRDTHSPRRRERPRGAAEAPVSPEYQAAIDGLIRSGVGIEPGAEVRVAARSGEVAVGEQERRERLPEANRTKDGAARSSRSFPGDVHLARPASGEASTGSNSRQYRRLP